MRPPRTAYVLLWFPKPSETFVFREVVNLRRMGLPLSVFSLYGELVEGLSAEMQQTSRDVERLGIPFVKRAPAELLHWLRRDRTSTMRVLRTFFARRWKGIEKSGESLWAMLCGFRLARRFLEEGIEHIHAPWASGPATAAWTASKLSGIPFSFTARAWDIYPPDSLLREKLNDAAFVRSETRTNIPYLVSHCGGDAQKIYLTYNGVPLSARQEAPVAMEPPYQLLALGRFVGKKGYDYLIQACRTLAEARLDYHLTLAGDGPRMRQLKSLARRLGVSDRISFPGFVKYDDVPRLFDSTDVLVMPSVVHSSGDRDGIPTVIMEALMHRVPVIATDVSGISEVIEDGKTGVLIPQKDSVAIAHGVQALVADRERALTLAEAGRGRVLRQFDPEQNHAKVLDLYVRSIARGRHLISQ